MKPGECPEERKDETVSGISRVTLIINGAERHLLYDSEKDTLADALRRLGLTGVKVGCGTGVCGACSVILNGSVVRACTRKMKGISEFSEITTIEGIGAPGRLHPLQQAWITYGGVQCGFCTPGFIVSAYALLRENPEPSREQVRQWFEKHRNVCRCTGYKPLVDAVMAAAAVMRGEKTMDDITYSYSNDGERIYGSRYPRPAALAKVCGVADYGDDIALKMPGSIAHLAVVLAGVPHAKILDIDTSEAEKMPGVIKIMTASDVKGSNNLAFQVPIPRTKGSGIGSYPVIAGETVNMCGDVVAIVAADTREHARAAAGKVKKKLELLPSYSNVLESFMPNAIRLHENVPNQYMFQPLLKGEDTEKLMESAPYVAEGSFHSQHEPHLPIEPDTVQAYYDENGMVTIQCKAHDLDSHRRDVSNACGIPQDNIRVILNPSGGSFGYATIGITACLAVTALQCTGRPCSLTLSYDEHQHITGKRASTYANGKIAVDASGKIVAVEYDLALDHGAYNGFGSIIFGNMVSTGFSGYNIPNIRALARGGMSNNAVCAAYRGFGAPQIYTTSESLIDMAAEACGMDPWEFRYLNAARPGDTSINQTPFESYVYPRLLELAKPTYDRYRAEAETAKKEGRCVGVGISMGGFSVTGGSFDSSEVALELMPDGGITNYNTWEDLGQGGDIGALTHTVKALEPLGIRPEQVKLVCNDTLRCPPTGIAAASRSHFMAGNATINAAEQLLNAMRKPDGSYRNYDEMVSEGIPTKYVGHYDIVGLGLAHCQDPNNGSGIRFPTFMNCVNLAKVEVDTETGKTSVLGFTAVADVGKIGNRLSVEGQGYGGISHSIGFALKEDYDASDRSGNMAYCGIPTITDIPDDFNLIFYEDNPRKLGPHGSCGASENFQASNHMAVINAINDACGVRIGDLPATPDKIRASLKARESGIAMPSAKYDFGIDFEDALEEIAANPL